MGRSDLDDVLDRDAPVFGADRSRVLRRIHHEFPEYCFVSREGNEIAGYVMARRIAPGVRIGPWVASPDADKDVPLSLLHAILSAAPGADVQVGVLESHRESLDILRRHGFRERPWSLRMRLGPGRFDGEAEWVFGIGSASKG